LPDADIGQQLSSGPQSVDEQHRAKQGRGKKPGEKNVRQESDDLLDDVRHSNPCDSIEMPEPCSR
jgi:hypothetical protein